MSGYARALIDAEAPKSRRGVRNEGKFLERMRKRYDEALAADQDNREAARNDIEFVYGKQYIDAVAEERRRLGKPVITVNRLMAFVAQVANNRLMNETDIRVLPDKDGTREIADIREGIIRNIYKNSQADFARDEALLYQVICGIGNFCLTVDYAGADVFDQDLKVAPIADPFAVVWDPLSVEPTGEDARWCFVTEEVPRDDFIDRWGEEAAADFAASSTFAGTSTTWETEDTIRVVSYYTMITEGTRTLALFKDGVTRDVDPENPGEWLPLVATRPDGEPYVREAPNRFCRLYICSGAKVLEGPFDYPVSSIPVFRVSGWVLRNDGRTHRWGLVRQAKDSQVLHNMWRSVLAEQLISAPRNKWLVPAGGITGYEKEWEQSHRSDKPFLTYNPDVGVPQRVVPPPLDAALVQEAALAAQDIRDVLNIHEASLGIQGNEVSARALQTRQSMSDIGTFIYHDRLRMADERCARLINELIPYVYDTQRVVTIIGESGRQDRRMINVPMDQMSDVTLGKYSVTVSTGPATATKRQLAAEQMMAFVNAVPQVAAQVMDLVAESQDWPKAAEFARRFRMTLPPGFVPAEDLPDDLRAQQAQNAEMEARQAEVAQRAAMAEIALREAKAAESAAKAMQLEATAQKAIMDARARMMDVASKVDDREFQQKLAEVDRMLAAFDTSDGQMRGEDQNAG